MIQSRFQNQHQSKHPQKPENGGSGPIAASRDATANIRRSGTRASTKETRASADSLRHEGVAWTQVAADDQVKNPEGENWFLGAQQLGSMGSREMRKANELQSREQAAERTKRGLGLEPDYFELDQHYSPDEDRLLRGRTRGNKKPPTVDPADSAIHALMNDTRAGDAKGARERFQEFQRQNVTRKKKK